MSMSMKHDSVVAVCAGAGGLIALVALAHPRAQTPADKPKFEVASVRENTSDDSRMMFGIQPGGRFTATAPLAQVIRFAYGLQRSQLYGAPDWVETARFDIVAKAESDIQGGPPGGPPGPLNFMLQDLLEDRFKLRT